jgi:capsular polysaccharide export protein|tara:strand:+ start:816 stop:2042 length:1227 start_codon:yes stop_codon:yes gene_type:complete
VIEQQKKYTLIARGSSHIRYFKQFAAQTSLNISVASFNVPWFLLIKVRHWEFTKHIDIDALVNPHLLKKAKKHKKLHHSFAWPLYEKVSRWLTKLDIAKSTALIEKENSDVVGVWNGQKQPSSSIAAAAKALKKEVVYFENGLFPNSTTCDWSGVNCENSLPTTKDFYKQFYENKALPCKLVPRKPVCEKACGVKANALPERYIFVPFQVETDSQIISNSPWIRSMGQYYQHLLNVIDKVDDPTLHIVIKEHPSDSIRHDNLHNKHERILFANYCETQELIERSLAVMTVNSTVGVESLLLDKPVVVLGRACYGIEGVTKLVRNETEMLEVMRNIELLAVDTEARCGYLNFMYNHYVIPTTWKNIDSRHVEALTKRLLKQDAMAHYISHYENREMMTENVVPTKRQFA